MKKITVRPAEIADLDALAGLFDQYRQFYEQAPNFDEARAFLANRMSNNESFILLAVGDSNEAIGFCQLYPTFCSVIAKPICVLYDLFVAPIARRSGAARLLLLAAEQKAKELACFRLDLTTARSNFPAQALYESLGWEKDNIFIAYNRSIQHQSFEME